MINELEMLDYLAKHHPVYEENAKELVDTLMPCEAEWPTMDGEVYAQAIISIGEAYAKLGEIEKAISILEKHSRHFQNLYEFNYGLKSDIFHNIGVYYANIQNREGTLNAFKKHVFYLLIDNVRYDDYEYFSFRPCSDYAFADLINNTLTVSNPKSFNDPDDCWIFSWINGQMCGLEKQGEVLAAQLLLEAYSYIKIRCFIRNKPLPTPNEESPLSRDSVEERYNPSMWDRYAQKHTGFCVKYVFPSEIVYERIGSDLENCELSRLGTISYEEMELKEAFTIADAFFKKSKQWEYEHEVRLLHYDPTWNEDYKPLKLPAGCVKEVYFGLKCSDEDKQKIRDALNGQQVDFYDIINNNDDFYKLTSLKCEST